MTPGEIKSKILLLCNGQGRVKIVVIFSTFSRTSSAKKGLHHDSFEAGEKHPPTRRPLVLEVGVASISPIRGTRAVALSAKAQA